MPRSESARRRSHADLRRSDDREPVDEVGVERGGVVGAVVQVHVAVVAAPDFGHDGPVGFAEPGAGGAGHRGEVRERGDAAADQAARDIDVRIAADVHVRAERDLRRVATGVPRGGAGQVEGPCHPIRVGADRERDALGDAGREPDDPWAGRRDVERDLRLPHPVQPLQPARVPVAVDGAVGQVGLQVRDQRREAVDLHRLEPEVKERGVAAADPEHESPARCLLHRGGDVRQRGRVPRVRVRHARREAEALGRARRERDRDERVTDEVLRVGERDAVPAVALRALGLADHRSRLRDAGGPQLHLDVPPPARPLVLASSAAMLTLNRWSGRRSAATTTFHRDRIRSTRRCAATRSSGRATR